MNLRIITLVGSFVLCATPALALSDIAPAPQKYPKPPVARQLLVLHKETVPLSRQIDGVARIYDLEKIRVGEYDVRLFGIVPPQLSASYGPQARAALDKAVQGNNLSCTIRDRAKDGRLLATCRTTDGVDPALDLLRKGLAVTARGSLAETELAASYITAEQMAQGQKLGLWSGVPAAPVQTITAPPVKPEVEISSEATLADAEKPVKIEDKKEEKKSTVNDEMAKIVPPMSVAELMGAQEIVPPVQADMVLPLPPEPTFIERYQFILAGAMVALTMISISLASAFQKRRDKQDEVVSIAAALRGELMAARAVCLSRLQQMAGNAESASTIAWPRIRVMVFQAYVGRIGMLGAELARQLSSIYGLASDYASYYAGATQDPAKTDFMSKQHALQKLVDHIETVLPRLASAESHRPVLAYSRPTKTSVSPLPPPPPPGKKDTASTFSTAKATFASNSSTDKKRPSMAMIGEVALADAPESPAQEPAPVSEPVAQTPVVTPEIVAEKKVEAVSDRKTEEKRENLSSLLALDESTASADLNNAQMPILPSSAAIPEEALVMDRSVFQQKADAKTEAQSEEVIPNIIPEVIVGAGQPARTWNDRTREIAQILRDVVATKAVDVIAPVTKEAMDLTKTTLGQIKESLHEKFSPPVYGPTQLDNEEYLAMLNAEEELFASFDQNENDVLFSPKKKRGGRK